MGSALVECLSGDPVEIVALTRNASGIDQDDRVQVAEIDFDNPSSLTNAMQGADRLFLSHGTSDRQVTNEILLIDAAVAAGVPHIVKLSAMGPPTRLHPFDWHMQIEAHLAKQESGYTVLRPSSFMDVLNRAKAQVVDGTWGGAAEDGAVNLIDRRDVADVARIALLQGRYVSSQRAYHLTGPASVTMPEIAGLLSKLLGRTVTYQRRTAAEHRIDLIRAGSTEMVADLLLGLDLIFRESVMSETTSTVSELLERPARSVSDWLADNLDGFKH